MIQTVDPIEQRRNVLGETFYADKMSAGLSRPNDHYAGLLGKSKNGLNLIERVANVTAVSRVNGSMQQRSLREAIELKITNTKKLRAMGHDIEPKKIFAYDAKGVLREDTI